MKKIKFIVVLFLAFLTACGSVGESSSNTNMAVSASRSETSLADTQSDGVKSSAPTAQISLNQGEETQAAPVVAERRIIRNADLSLETAAPEEAQQKITQIVESRGGFVMESDQSSSDVKAAVRDTVTMTVRVPAEKFTESLDEIRKTGSRVISETVKGQDVTEEFVDIEARLKAKRALEEQFIEIMKRGTTVQDALNVQRELGNVREEIEQIEGRKRFLENQTGFSTLKIRLLTPTAFADNSKGFFYRLGDAFNTGLSGALSFILVLVTALVALLPFLILVVLPIYLLIRYLLKKRGKQKLASEIAREEIKSE